jgi:hypothetical protein
VESSVEPDSGTAVCGPECDCGTASGGKGVKRGRGIKIAVSLIVLLAVVGILAYKLSTTKKSTTNAAKTSGFSIAQSAPEAAAGTAKKPAKRKDRIGEDMASLNDLNKVAVSQDAVFIYFPNTKGEPVSDLTYAAVLAAQKTLKKNNIELGLYTLPVSSPDYAGISAQVQAPAVLVACKGEGSSAVTGEVTEEKLLQSYTASSSAGGCGPSGCGPASPGCQ